jgi:hypothetical protein
MATGPQGRQGQQGAYGPRGVTGALGWGYGTTTGPTGVLGTIPTVIPPSSTFNLTFDNSGTLFRVQTTSNYQYSNVTSFTAFVGLPTLASSNAGIFWTISNDTVNQIAVLQSPSGPQLLTVNPRASGTVLYSGSAFLPW